MEQFAEGVDENTKFELGAENEIGIAIEPVPEHDGQVVLEEPGQHAISAIANKLGKFAFGGNNPGQVVVLIRRAVLGHLRWQVLRGDEPGLGFGQAVVLLGWRRDFGSKIAK